MSTIELKWRVRETLSVAQTKRKFLDIVIDGKSMYDRLGDLISPLGWLAIEETQKIIGSFLLKGPSDFPNNRRSIYVCPECADLGCGALSAVIEKDGDVILWRDFGYENDYEDTVHFENYAQLGPYRFKFDEYENALSQAKVMNL